MVKKATPPAPEPLVTTLAKPSRKGVPPAAAGASVAAGNSTTTADTALVDLGFKVPPEFRKNFRLFCATHDLSQVDAFKEGMRLLMEKRGWPTA